MKKMLLLVSLIVLQAGIVYAKQTCIGKYKIVDVQPLVSYSNSRRPTLKTKDVEIEFFIDKKNISLSITNLTADKPIKLLYNDFTLSAGDNNYFILSYNLIPDPSRNFIPPRSVLPQTTVDVYLVPINEDGEVVSIPYELRLKMLFTVIVGDMVNSYIVTFDFERQCSGIPNQPKIFNTGSSEPAGLNNNQEKKEEEKTAQPTIETPNSTQTTEAFNSTSFDWIGTILVAILDLGILWLISTRALNQ